MGEEQASKPTVTTQPLPQPSPSLTAPRPSSSPDQEGLIQSLVLKLTTKEGWIGDYDFKELCMPRFFPWSKPSTAANPTSNREAPFYGLHDKLPLVVAALCGLQHALAMIAGLITPPIILSSSLSLPPETQAYMISASLITSGLLSAIQITKIPLPFGYQLGTGLLSVVGTSFSTLTTATAIFNNLYADGTCPMITNPDGSMSRGPCPDAYGYLLGTAAVCALLEMALSFVPVRTLKRAFPPQITGVVVFIIGLSLIGESGFVNWAGGSGACHYRTAEGPNVLCPGPNPLYWGDARYLGLGLLSFLTIVVVEIFGSPAMRNASIVIGLLFPMVVAGPLGYVGGSNIKSAPAITFLWTTTFRLRVYGPAVLPLLAVYIALMMEAIGDITATSEVSRLEVDGEKFDRRIQGGVLADGLNGLLSALFTITPMSVFAQNNGVISITRCANRQAGYFCCFWLVLFGVIGKIAGCVLSIPNSILGGVTTFLFASVATSGLSILSKVKYTRRTRFVLAASMSLGMGNLLVPSWSSFLFTYSGDNKGLTGFLQSIQIVISTPFLISAIAGIVANLILPRDAEDRNQTPSIDDEEAAASTVDEKRDFSLGEASNHHLQRQQQAP
ncbi:Xanthine/uracil permease [Violaceomyces palustris]|uniref:Xanthine/uracil permease n=1 Tax=Violaceomyces palustris TaxID=1673888 RepID=A0ACD0P587_9BASI|nr:Xanthine/uracil permease [Violaceomyces palustris]